MPRTAEDVETYLLALNRTFENDKGTLVVSAGEASPPIAIRVAPPIVAVRVEIGPLPVRVEDQAKLYRRLLEFNATDLIHAAYGISGNTLVLSAGLELANLDQNELEATLSDIDVALASHISELKLILGQRA